MKRFLLIVAPILLLCLVSTGRENPIVYDNGPPNLSVGYFFGMAYGEFILDFSIGQPTQITGVNFWTPGTPGNAYGAVYADNSGAPLREGSPLFSGTTAAVSTDLSDPVYGLDPFHNFIIISAFSGHDTYWRGLGESDSNYWAPSISGSLGQLSWIHQLSLNLITLVDICHLWCRRSLRSISNVWSPNPPP